MPCGGIFPIIGSPSTGRAEDCFFCSGGPPVSTEDCELWVEEWDAPLHRVCLWGFLCSEEGRILIEHGHNVIQY